MIKLKMTDGCFSYKNREIIKYLNFEIPQNSITAILGLNGQGKSTLLKLIMKILKLQSGEILTNTTFSYLPQSFFVAYDFSVKDIVLMGKAGSMSIFEKPSKKDIENTMNTLSILGIQNLANKNFKTLSGGQKKLVLFARALHCESDFLLLDEPMSELDLKNQDKILKLLLFLKSKNLSMIFTTHDPSHALKVADFILVLFSDLSYAFGKTNEILTDSNLEKLYSLKFFHDPLLKLISPKF